MPKVKFKLGSRKHKSAVEPPVKELHLALNHGDSQRIAEAVVQAENQTSAEIMVKLSAVTSMDEPMLDIARAEFARMGLPALALDNGVLVYISLNRHAVEIVVGQGAVDALPQALWDAAVQTIVGGFKGGNPADGIVQAVRDMTAPLAQAFPVTQPDTVNLPNVMED